MSKNHQSQLKQLISRGKKQGYLTYSEVNDHLPVDLVEPDQVEEVIRMINDMGIFVCEKRPNADDLLLTQNTITDDDDDTLCDFGLDLGRTTDPVRMYMRDMGTVCLLDREREIAIAKRIEEGVIEVLRVLASYPKTIQQFFDQYDEMSATEGRLTDLIVGFIEDDESPNTEIGSLLPQDVLNKETEDTENIALADKASSLIVDRTDEESDLDSVDGVALTSQDHESAPDTEKIHTNRISCTTKVKTKIT